MNSIAGFLPSLPPRPPSDSYAARSDSETLANSQKGEGEGFDAVLSGLSPNSASDEAATGTAAPVRSSIARMAGEDASASVVSSEAPSAAAVSGSAAMVRGVVAIGDAANSVPANTQASANAALSAAATSSSLNGQGAAPSAVPLGAMPPVASVAQQGGASAATAASLAAWRFGSTLTANKAGASSRQSASVATTPKDASVTTTQTSDNARAPASAPPLSNSAKIPPGAAMSGDNPAQSNLGAASPVESVPAAGDPSSANMAAITTPGSASGSAASSPAKAGATAAPGTAANADAALTTADATPDAVAAIAASLQTAMPVIQGVGTSASKSSRADAAWRSASALASMATGSTSADAIRRAEGADTATASTGITDPTAQAAFVATIVPNSASEGLPTGSDSTPSPGSSQLQVQARAVANGGLASGVPNGNGDSAAASSIAAVERSDAGVSADMKVTAVSSATYFAPVARLSPVQQIADVVIGALPDLSQSLSGSAASGPSTAAGATGLAPGAAAPDPTAALTQSALGPVKTLNLQLEPPNLGTVTITLNLSAGGLDVQMAASQSSTMSLIEKDKDALSNQLRQSGYSVAGIAVTLGGHDGGNVANNGSATQDQAGQALSQGGSEAMSYGGSSNGNGSAQNNAENRSEGAAARQDLLGGTADTLAGVASGRALTGDLYI